MRSGVSRYQGYLPVTPSTHTLDFKEEELHSRVVGADVSYRDVFQISVCSPRASGYECIGCIRIRSLTHSPFYHA